MICEQCKACWNYKVCENGCFGSVEPCTDFINEDTENGLIFLTKEQYSAVFNAWLKVADQVRVAVSEIMEHFKAAIKGLTPELKKMTASLSELAEVAEESTKEEKSRRRFEAVACKGRNKTPRMNKKQGK